ncbi:MAG: hypothetical protein FWE69_00960 [Clostridiales bacterium]|nr:hypothetical protein [Clostridiales bacterium]
MHYENILEELYYGNVHPTSKCYDRDSEYAKFVGIIGANEERLAAFLCGIPSAEKEQHLFSQLMNAQGEVSAFNELNRFIEGFQLGAKFMLDTFLVPQNGVIRDIC